MEETGLSIWLRESGLAFFTSLTLHSLAMAVVVGLNLVVCLRLAGFAANIPERPLQKFYPLQWCSVALVAVSGLALLLAYPAKALTNPVFFLKLASLSIALVISRHFEKSLRFASTSRPVPRSTVGLAYVSLVLWLITLCAGRFLAYTYNYLLASRYF